MTTLRAFWTAAIVSAVVSAVNTQASSAPAFEVASVKQNPGGLQAGMIGPRAEKDRLTVTNMRLRDLIVVIGSVEHPTPD